MEMRPEDSAPSRETAPTPETPKANRIIREPECRSMTGLARSTRYELEQAGKFPRRVRITGNRTGWLYLEVLEWIRSRERVELHRAA
jgi:prophage regulatory protein